MDADVYASCTIKFSGWMFSAVKAERLAVSPRPSEAFDGSAANDQCEAPEGIVAGLV
jgi:hypothetical protein